jgi:subtilase family serine protease
MAKHSLRSRVATRRALPAVATVAVVLAMSAGAAGAASASSGSGNGGTVTVPQGAGAAALPAGTVLGNTPPSTPVQVSFVLRARNLGSLESHVQSGWGSRYLTTRQFAATYGQSTIVIRAIKAYLAHFGITTSAYSDGLDISANGTAGEFDKALDVLLQDFRVRDNGAHLDGRSRFHTVHGSIRDPRLPSSVGSPILAILGLSNYSPFNSDAVAATGHRLNATPAAGTGIPAGDGLGPQDFVNDYNLAPLESHGAKGQGETVGIVTLASIDPTVPLGFWNDVLGLNEPASRLKIVNVDGGSGTPSLDAGSDETDLDVEQSGAIAPRANVRLYEAPNTDPGFADAFFAAASDNIADSVSASWGESETFIQEGIANATEPAALAQVYDEAFLEFAAQGQSAFTSSGDFGAYDALPDTGTTNLTVDNPADSPYITAAGGTTLAGQQTYGVFDASGNLTGTESVNIPSERSWSWDYLWPLYQALGAPDETTAATAFDGGDGGGYSTIEPRPSYQRNVSSYNDRQYLTGTDFTTAAPGIALPTEFSYNPTPALKSGVASRGRAVPDVSTNADPQTGYAVYDPNLFAGSYAQYGGTSFVAPQLNGSTAVIDSFVHHRVGFWNPVIYGLANSHSSPFTPLNDTKVYSGKTYLSQTDAEGNTTALPGNFTNNNLFYAGKPGTTWNPASGLGIPNLSALGADFAH